MSDFKEFQPLMAKIEFHFPTTFTDMQKNQLDKFVRQLKNDIRKNTVDVSLLREELEKRMSVNAVSRLLTRLGVKYNG